MKTLKLSWFSSGENKHKYLNLRGPIEDLDQTTIQGVMDFMVGNHAFPAGYVTDRANYYETIENEVFDLV